MGIRISGMSTDDALTVVLDKDGDVTIANTSAGDEIVFKAAALRDLYEAIGKLIEANKL